MPRVRQEKLNEAARQEIKDTARQLMAEKGTAGLSLRAIARSMGMTAPALYHYFASMDDLITALILDAFTGHADYVRHARDASAEEGQPFAQQLYAAVWAYRAWALENPTDFQLIYGNPIPGYVAPSDVTTPAARLTGQVFMETVTAAMEADEITIPEQLVHIPPTVRDHYRQKYGMDDHTAQVFHLMNQVWGAMHGMVALEIYNHAAPVIGDTDAFYDQAIRFHMGVIGIQLG